MRIVTSLLVIGIAGCVGKAPPNVADELDAGVDAPAELVEQIVSGTTIDYFGNVPLDQIAVTTEGLEPPQSTTSASDGAYQLGVAVGSKVFLTTSRTAYRPTRNMPITIDDMPVTQDVYVMSVQDVRNQYTAVGATPTAGTGFLAVELRRNNGTPLEGVAPADVQLLDAQDNPVVGVLGPYFFNEAGSVTTLDLQPASAGYGTPPRARMAILDLPPGTYTLAVSYPNGQGGTTINTTTFSISADGATAALSQGAGGGGGMNITDPTFAEHIHPKLQRAASGGLGCANCHTAGGPAALLPFDDPAATVLANMTARPGVIDLEDPAESLVLTKPLYEPPPLPQNHPNATFLDTLDPDYRLLLLWIENGAKP
jgi:hypothetical protein